MAGRSIQIKKSTILWFAIVTFFFGFSLFGGAQVAYGFARQYIELLSQVSLVLSGIATFIAFGYIIGFRKALGILIFLASFAFVIETIGIITGFPYGSFAYLGSLGFKLGGIVPWTLPFAWLPLIIASWYISQKIAKRTWVRVILIVVILVLFDIVLDPAAVSLGFWEYSSPFFYGVPLSNFVGWLVSGTIAAIAISTVSATKKKGTTNVILLPTMCNVAFFIGVNAQFQNWTSVIIGFAITLVIAIATIKESN